MNTGHASQAAFLHVTPGRVRIKCPRLKRNPARALQAERDLTALSGVTWVRANPLTGSILIHFSPERTDARGLLDTLRQRGYLSTEPPQPVHRGASAPSDDPFTACCRLIAKELLSAAIGRAFPHPVVTTLLAIV